MRRTPPDFLATHPARPPCGARPTRPLADRATNARHAARTTNAHLADRGCSVRRWAAARPRDRHTRATLGVLDLEARPGPAATHQRRSRLLPTGTATTSPAGLAPPSDRATMPTGTATTSPAGHTPPTSRAAAHRHRCMLAPQVLSGTKLSPLNTSVVGTGQLSPCSS